MTNERAGARITRVVAVLAATLTLACGGDDAARRAAAPAATVPNNSGGSPAAVSRAPAGPAPAKSGASSHAGAAQAGTAPRVVIAGTSLTAGLGLDPSIAYPALLQAKADSAGLRVRIENAGLSGETSAGLVRRLAWLLGEPTAAVVIETGANDGLRGLDVDSLAANLRRAVATVRRLQPTARVLLVQMEAPPNFGARYTQRFHEAYADVADETDATLLPFLLDGVAGDPSLNQADGLHPNAEGERRVAAILWRALAPVLDSLDRAGRAG